MSVVRINALDVPPEMADRLEERFAARAGEVETMDGFEGFELLRPTDDSGRYLVYTRWRDAAAFQAWVDSREFQHGHAQQSGGDPAASGSELLSFDVVLAAGPATAPTIGLDEEE